MISHYYQVTSLYPLLYWVNYCYRRSHLDIQLSYVASVKGWVTQSDGWVVLSDGWVVLSNGWVVLSNGWVAVSAGWISQSIVRIELSDEEAAEVATWWDNAVDHDTARSAGLPLDTFGRDGKSSSDARLKMLWKRALPIIKREHAYCKSSQKS